MLASITTALLVLVMTGRFVLALAVGGAEAIAKLVLYFVHERMWNQIRFGRGKLRPAVLWFTGLSGAGKSTIAKRVAEALSNRGFTVELLDGDAIRAVFPRVGFTREEREEHVRRVGHLASRLEKHGIVVIASLISPYQESRDFVRRLCSNFIEVYLATPLEVCEARDIKGLYAKARSGKIKGFTGVDDPYEPPRSPELKLDASRISVEQAAAAVLKRFDNAKAG
jgi:adenylylsulfate kinase